MTLKKVYKIAPFSNPSPAQKFKMTSFCDLPNDIARAIVIKAIQLRHQDREPALRQLEAARDWLDGGKLRRKVTGPKTRTSRRGDVASIGFDVDGHRFMVKRIGNRFMFRRLARGPLDTCPFEKAVLQKFEKVFAGRDVRAFSSAEWIPAEWQ